MNKELNIGDYVRTIYGTFAKVIYTEIDEEKDIIDFSEDIIPYHERMIDNCFKEELDIYITKSSPNIVDLLEVGDALKLYSTNQIQQVLYIDEKEIDLTDYVYYSSKKFKQFIKDDIEWVITHEQIEQMKYKVGE